MTTKIDGTIIIIDVGRNTSTPDEKGEKSFFQKARECAVCVIERKIISQGKNHLGIILVGTEKTNNNLAEQSPGLYRHIDVLVELRTPTWKMIRDLPENPSNKTGDWFDALIVAADHFNSQHSKFFTKKIVLMTNFQVPTNSSSKMVQQMINGFIEEKFEIDVIGLDLFDDNLKGDNLDLPREFVEATNGATANFEYAMQYLSFHRKRALNAIPWQVDLKIGPNISIPVAAYLRMKDEPVIKKWSTAVKDLDTGKASTKTGLMKSRIYLDQDKKPIVDFEKIKGFHYGQSIIPLSEADKSMLYESGEKCLSLYGFTHKSNIGWQCLNGDNLSYVFGRRGDRRAQQAIMCLAECLHRLDMVGIVRRVYNNNNAPKMFALFPVIDSENFFCLSMTAICYKEDIKYMSFPSTNLKKYTCTEEQVSAFKDLIKAMDLTRAYDETYDDSEAFPIAKTVSPFAQYLLDCIAFRAMNPDKPLPPPREEILNLFKVPPELEMRSQKPLEKIKSLFILNKVEKKISKKKISLADDPIDNSGQLPSDEAQLVVPRITLPDKPLDKDQIGTLDPINDFNQQINKGKSLSELVPGITKAIEDLIHVNLDGKYKKGFDVMMFFRKECASNEPSLYNSWLQTFKATLNNQKQNDVLNLIKQRNVNFILKSENSLSTYETEESQDDSQLYQNDTIPNSTDFSIPTEINDIFEDF